VRLESSVTSISWIPSESVSGLPKVAFVAGATHYDDPPPDRISPAEDLEGLFAAERFRFANHLSAWIDVDGGRVVDAGYSGRGYISCTRVRLGRVAEIVFQPAEFPELRAEPEIGTTTVRFVQTTGGRTGMPAPRRVRKRPLVQWASPSCWTTLALTISADGSSDGELVGASQFPRHWVYGSDGVLESKSGFAASREWLQTSFGVHSPWGDEDSKPFVTLAESALERQLSETIMRGGEKPAVRKVPEGSLLTTQGEEGADLYLLLDGILEVAVDGEKLADLGPGAIVGERAVLEGGRRTASLQAVTDCTVAVAAPGQIDRDKLAVVSQGHHRENPATT